MTGWYAQRTPDRSAKAVIAVTLLALLLVAVVPVAMLAGVVMMVLGHVVGGLALFCGSVLAAGIAVALPGISGKRPLRQLGSRCTFRGGDVDGSPRPDGWLVNRERDHTGRSRRQSRRSGTSSRLPAP